ncbi:MAG TPA: hypothetical protein VFP88_02125 [Rhodanobacteraceae bacterium]|nr:hypothetical protein [Rhodanobacteraceae bacterium]
MTYVQAEFGEFEEVRQHHDAFMERGRLELIAEQLRAQGDAERLGSVERHMQELDSVLQD